MKCTTAHRSYTMKSKLDSYETGRRKACSIWFTRSNERDEASAAFPSSSSSFTSSLWVQVNVTTLTHYLSLPIDCEGDLKASNKERERERGTKKEKERSIHIKSSSSSSIKPVGNKKNKVLLVFWKKPATTTRRRSGRRRGRRKQEIAFIRLRNISNSSLRLHQ